MLRRLNLASPFSWESTVEPQLWLIPGKPVQRAQLNTTTQAQLISQSTHLLFHLQNVQLSTRAKWFLAQAGMIYAAIVTRQLQQASSQVLETFPLLQ